MTGSFRSCAVCARLAKVLDKLLEVRPDIFAANEFNSLVLAVMSGDDVIMLVFEDSELEIINIGNVNALIQE
jgi:hypothetical protein